MIKTTIKILEIVFKLERYWMPSIIRKLTVLKYLGMSDQESLVYFSKYVGYARVKIYLGSVLLKLI